MELKMIEQVLVLIGRFMSNRHLDNNEAKQNLIEAKKIIDSILKHMPEEVNRIKL